MPNVSLMINDSINDDHSIIDNQAGNYHFPNRRANLLQIFDTKMMVIMHENLNFTFVFSINSV